jgi:hypothetical protein
MKKRKNGKRELTKRRFCVFAFSFSFIHSLSLSINETVVKMKKRNFAKRRFCVFAFSIFKSSVV